jgi:hypothetical protein
LQRRRQAQDRGHLGQASLLPADDEHLNPVHPGVEVAVGRCAELVGLLGEVLGLGEATVQDGEHGVVHDGHVAEDDETGPFGELPELPVRVPGFGHPAQCEQPSSFVGPAVTTCPRIVQARRQFGQLPAVCDQLLGGDGIDDGGFERGGQYLGIAVTAGGGQRLGADLVGLVVSPGKGQGPGQ